MAISVRAVAAIASVLNVVVKHEPQKVCDIGGVYNDYAA